MKIALLNDTHCGIKNSSDIFIEYQRQFYTDIFFPYLKKHNITEIVHLGDYYDNRRTINLKALYANRRMFLDVLREEKIHLHIINGNHDEYWSNTSAISSLKELLGYYLDEVKIHQRPTSLTFAPNYTMAVIPWINKENLRETKDFLMSLDPDTTDLVGGHFELSGFEMMKGVISHGVSDLITAADLKPFKKVVSGHYHKKSTKGNITYLGAQMQFTWNDCGEKKYFHVLNTETGSITAVRNPIEMFAKIDYDDTTDTDWNAIDLTDYKHKYVKVFVAQKTDVKKYERFIDRLCDIETHDLKIIENFQVVLSQNNADVEPGEIMSTQDIIDQYINDLEFQTNEFNHEKLKMKFGTLYNRALLEDL